MLLLYEVSTVQLSVVANIAKITTLLYSVYISVIANTRDISNNTNTIMYKYYAQFYNIFYRVLTSSLELAYLIPKSILYFIVNFPIFLKVHWKLRKLPGPPTEFLFGHVNIFFRTNKFMGVALEWQRTYPIIQKAYLMLYPLVVVYSPEAVQTILSKKQKHNDKSRVYDILVPILGNGLITCEAARWSKRRKLLTPAFHFYILADFFEVFKERTNDYIGTLKKSTIIENFEDICPFTKDLTFNIICETALGLPHEERPERKEVMQAMSRLEKLALYRWLYPWLLCDWIFKLSAIQGVHDKKSQVLQLFTDKVIRKRREILRDDDEDGYENFSEKKSSILIDLLLKLKREGRSLTSQEITEEINTFIFAGYNTTNSTISFCIYLLGAHQDIQKKAIEEIDGIFADSKREPTLEDLKQMKYLDRCIKETLRLYPSVPIIARRCTEDEIVDGFTIPKDADVIISPYVIHRNHKLFPNPEKFNPDNFLPENMRGRHPYSYIPFSAGPRNCIGKRFANTIILTAISRTLREFTIESLYKPEELELLPKTILEPMNGLPIKLTPRRDYEL